MWNVNLKFNESEHEREHECTPKSEHKCEHERERKVATLSFHTCEPTCTQSKSVPN